MKKILITGSNSYVGINLNQWLLNEGKNEFNVDTISLRTDNWKKINFSSYDVIINVAGIAHVTSDPSAEELYKKINCDLAIEVAKKAKSEGVDQYIFISSIMVYGNQKNIDKNTVPKPTNIYGKMKLLAENGLNELESDDFKIVILRPPMIYGKNCKGNYPKLSLLAKKLPLFPDFNNQRSMIYIDNLCEFIKLLILNEERGTYCPQNSEYTNTSEIVSIIAKVHGKKIILIRIFNPLIDILVNKIDLLSKVFGNLIYDKELSNYKQSYYVKKLYESIIETETQEDNV